MGFFVEVLISGLMAGVLYSLVALGFVLIFKASGVFNFAQGAMVLFAALTFVRLLDILKDTFAPITLALILTIVMMFMLAMAIERLVLRPLVNQPGISLFMATLGVAYFLDGFGQTLWGSDIYTLNIGIPKGSLSILESVFEGGVLVAKEDLVATVIAGVLVVTLAIFFQKTRIGRALRAVADDHQAAQSIGIPLNYIWVIVWTVAGLVALVAGVIWGSKLGVQFSLSLIALKALPVLILGGFESVLGAVIGGLIIGAGEKLAEIYLGPYVGGGIEYWFAYMLALGFLILRPQGLFGEVHIDRV
ncbi:MAG: branched-chain amino acid ABC transporter permease [Proteobacteria bacterium]|nr:branched-chain amino acid ABC transporter permease [Pseudomonadota bacterium]